MRGDGALAVIAGHSRPKDGVLSHVYVSLTVMAGLVPAISLRWARPCL
jgi:hypothetical protein